MLWKQWLFGGLAVGIAMRARLRRKKPLITTLRLYSESISLRNLPLKASQWLALVLAACKTLASCKIHHSEQPRRGVGRGVASSARTTRPRAGDAPVGRRGAERVLDAREPLASRRRRWATRR